MELQQQPRIFVVEDNLMYQQLIGKELAPVSTDIHYFTSGESCLESLDKTPSIVILDYNLEGEINGLDTLQQIRKFDDSIFVILFSSRKDLQTQENMDHYGTFNFIEKKGHSFRLLRKMIHSTYHAVARQ